jgi:hypothetical protein
VNEPLIATEFAAVLSTVAPLTALLVNAAAEPGAISGAQSGDIVTRPLILVHAGEFTPYGPRRKGQIEIELRSRLGDESPSPPNHAARFEALWTYLLGAPGATYTESQANMAAAKAAVIAALNARNNVELIDYTPAPQAVVADAQDNDLRTALKLLMIFRFIPHFFPTDSSGLFATDSSGRFATT